MEFNFDSNWRFHLDKSNPEEYVLDCHKQDVLPENFWKSKGHDIDVVECVSAIVGVNGSGKTTVIRAIQEILATSNHTIEHIIVYQHTEKHHGQEKNVLKCQIHLLKHITSDMLKLHCRRRGNGCSFLLNEKQKTILYDYLPKPFGNGKKIEELPEDDSVYRYAYDFFTLSSIDDDNRYPLLEEIRQKVTISQNVDGFIVNTWSPLPIERVGLNSFRPVYYSPFYTTETIIDSTRVTDISTTHCLIECAENNIKNYQGKNGQSAISPIDAHRAEEYPSVLRFMRDCSKKHPKLFEQLHIPRMQGVIIEPEYRVLEYVKEDLRSLRDNAANTQEGRAHGAILKEQNPSYDRLDRIVKLIVGKHTNEFFINAFLCYFACLCRDTLHGSVIISSKLNYEPDTIDKLIEMTEYVIDKIPMASASTESVKVYQKLHQHILSKIESIDKNAFDCFKSLDLLYEDNLKRNFMLVPPENMYCRVNDKDWFNWLLDFIVKYYKCKSIRDFLSFSFLPRLSSGEMAFITFFSRFYMKLIYREPTINENILLFMDEFETVLHPQWQLELVKLTISFLESYLPQSHVHVIFASHSPMLLSDIPAGNVCFLDKENGKTVQRKSLMNTYGANVFDLYRNSYFLYEGTIGKFASSRIQELLDFVNEKSKDAKNNLNRDDVYKEALLIGDPLIRTYIIEKLIHRRENSRSMLEEQRNLLKRRLEQVEKELEEESITEN